MKQYEQDGCLLITAIYFSDSKNYDSFSYSSKTPCQKCGVKGAWTEHFTFGSWTRCSEHILSDATGPKDVALIVDTEGNIIELKGTIDEFINIHLPIYIGPGYHNLISHIKSKKVREFLATHSVSQMFDRL